MCTSLYATHQPSVSGYPLARRTHVSQACVDVYQPVCHASAECEWISTTPWATHRPSLCGCPSLYATHQPTPGMDMWQPVRHASAELGWMCTSPWATHQLSVGGYATAHIPRIRRAYVPWIGRAGVQIQHLVGHRSAIVGHRPGLRLLLSRLVTLPHNR
jgi:hypothetical protein